MSVGATDAGIDTSLPTLTADPDNYKASTVLVRFRGDTTGECRLQDTNLGSTLPLVPCLREIEVPAGVSVQDVVSRYLADPDVLYAQPDYRVQLTDVDQAVLDPNDYFFKSNPLLWGLNNTGQSGGTPDADIDAPEAWEISVGDQSVTVGVIDTGIDYTHPDLYLNVALNAGEIPLSKAGLRDLTRDTNRNGMVDFYDLNSLDANRAVVRDVSGNPINASFASDRNGNGYIDAGDLLADPTWRDGIDQDYQATRANYTDDLIGWDFVNNDPDPRDDNSHGTHVSGTIGAIGNNTSGIVGVSWTTSLMGLKLLDANGSGSGSNAIRALNYALGLGVHISNNSYTGGPFDSAMLEAIRFAGTQGHLFVAAAGNSGLNNDVSPGYPASYTEPNIISVAASDRFDRIAAFSNYGATSVDLAAPGVEIASTTLNNMYSSKSGTSMATPHVSGAVALVWASDPGLSASEVRARILGGVDNIYAQNTTRRTATDGRLNVANALKPDLSWTSAGTTAQVQASQGFTINRNFRVSGSGAQSGFSIAYYRSVDSVFGNGDDVLLGQESIATAGAQTGQHDGQSPSFAVSTPGAYTLFAKLDQTNLVTEFSEQNNVYSIGSLQVNSADTVSVNDVRVLEGQTGSTIAQFTVQLSQPLSHSVSITYDWTDGTARTADDYVAVAGSLVFAPGETSKPVTVTVKSDSVAESDETFFLNLRSASGAQISDSQGVATVLDDDALISVSDVVVVEPDTGTVNATFVVNLSKAQSVDTTVNFSTADGTAVSGSDYTGVSGVVRIAAGTTTASVTVAVIGDDSIEGDETVKLILSNATNGILADAEGVATIRNDDSNAIASDKFGYQARVGTFENVDLVPGGTGVTTVISSADNNYAGLSLGGTFNFYGTTYTSAYVTSNGLISFGSVDLAFTNTDLTSSPSMRTIAPMWDDWKSMSPNQMLLRRVDDVNGDGVADRLILEWNRVQGKDSSPSDVTFQAILQLNTGATPGKIIFNYPDLYAGDFRSNGGSATIGIKDAGFQTNNRLLVSYNSVSPYVASGTAIEISSIGVSSLSSHGETLGVSERVRNSFELIVSSESETRTARWHLGETKNGSGDASIVADRESIKRGEQLRAARTQPAHAPHIDQLLDFLTERRGGGSEWFPISDELSEDLLTTLD